MPQLQKLLLEQDRAVHLSASFQQIVRLVYQEDIISRGIVTEKSLQVHIRVKEIIIVADHRIRKQAHVQTHLKRTYHVFFRVPLNLLSAEAIRGSQQIIHRLIDTVVMPLGVRTMLRITFRFVHEADLLLRRENHALEGQSSVAQKLKGIIRYRSCNGFGRQIENLLPHTAPHGLHGRIYGRYRLADSGRSLQKQFLLMIDGTIYMRDKFLLTIPVRKRKLQFLNGILPLSLPPTAVRRPFMIGGEELPEPSLQLLKGKIRIKILKMLRRNMTVGHTHLNLLQVILQGINIGIALCLRKMKGQWFPPLGRITIGAFDLIDHDPAILSENTVGTPVNDQTIVLFLHGQLQRNLSQILRPHTPLNLAVNAASLPAGSLGRDLSSVINIAVTQNKLHQTAHGDPDLVLTLCACSI